MRGGICSSEVSCREEGNDSTSRPGALVARTEFIGGATGLRWWLRAAEITAVLPRPDGEILILQGQLKAAAADGYPARGLAPWMMIVSHLRRNLAKKGRGAFPARDPRSPAGRDFVRRTRMPECTEHRYQQESQKGSARREDWQEPESGEGEELKKTANLFVVVLRGQDRKACGNLVESGRNKFDYWNVGVTLGTWECDDSCGAIAMAERSRRRRRKMMMERRGWCGSGGGDGCGSGLDGGQFSARRLWRCLAVQRCSQ